MCLLGLTAVYEIRLLNLCVSVPFGVSLYFVIILVTVLLNSLHLIDANSGKLKIPLIVLGFSWSKMGMGL